MAEEFAMNKNDNEEFDNVIKMNEENSSEEAIAEEISESENTGLEITQQPSTVFRRALLGGYKTVDVDKYIHPSLILERSKVKVPTAFQSEQFLLDLEHQERMKELEDARRWQKEHNQKVR